MYPRQLRSDKDADGRLDEQVLRLTQPLILTDLLSYALAYSLTQLLSDSPTYCVDVYLLRLYSLCDA